MNHVDLLVKSQIQESFKFYKTRWDVLYHILLGTSHSYFFDGNSIQNSFTSLLEDENNIGPCSTLSDKSDEDMMDAERVAYRLQEIITDFYIENIDEISSNIQAFYPLNPFLPKPAITYIHISCLNKNCDGTVLKQIIDSKKENPDIEIDNAWKEAIFEFCDVTLELVNKAKERNDKHISEKIPNLESILIKTQKTFKPPIKSRGLP